MLLASGDPGAVQMEPGWPVSGLCAPYSNVEREERGRTSVTCTGGKLRISALPCPLFLAKSESQCYSKKKEKNPNFHVRWQAQPAQPRSE